MNRRHFLKNSLVALLASAPLQHLLALEGGAKYVANLGLQLYTLRNPFKNDLEGALKLVAEAGYKQVEPYGYPNADRMIAVSKDLGLKVNSTHFGSDTVVNPKDAAFSDFQKIVEKAHADGLTHLVVPNLSGDNRSSLAAYQRVAENMNKAAVKAKAAGIQLAYHNHAFEFKAFEGGRSGYDVLMDEFKEVKFELDLFWVKVAGIDPVSLIEKLSGRISQLHLKDLNRSVQTPNFGGLPADSFKEVGNGGLDWVKILSAAEKAGVEHCHVEQDQSPDALASVKQSASYLQKL